MFILVNLLNALDNMGMYEPMVPPAAPTVASIKIRSIDLPKKEVSIFLRPRPVRLELSLRELSLYL